MINNTSPHIADLLHLPLEMRHRIYDYLLELIVLPPTSPYEFKGDRRVEDQYWGSMFYERDLHTASTIGPYSNVATSDYNRKCRVFLDAISGWKELA